MTTHARFARAGRHLRVTSTGTTATAASAAPARMPDSSGPPVTAPTAEMLWVALVPLRHCE